MSKAKVALARKLAVILHRMLVNAMPFGMFFDVIDLSEDRRALSFDD
jgi:hypothetical protein